ncbi:MAG TPA: TonB-dependent receptor [Steroidobacteraceae bacterium]|nr:TonB-dependent receptor [Steroidobacteraceae bacterium]
MLLLFAGAARLQAQTGAIPSADRLETVVIEATRLGGPEVSPTGANDYAVTAQDIDALPAGDTAAITDVLTHMPGVAIDQNQQIHIRNTEGPQFQYQINGVLIPFDINTNPPFLSMINPMFVKQLDLLDGILPARYSYATGGVVDIRTKEGCDQPGGELSVLAGQRSTLQPSLQYAACSGQLSSYVSVLYDQSNTAFSSATPGTDAIHDRTRQGQAFGFFSYPLDNTTRLTLLLSAASSSNQLPNVPGLDPQFELAGVPNAPPSSAIDSDLDFGDYLAVLSLIGSPTAALSYQLGYSEHGISQRFRPDAVGELVYQGVASSANHVDHDHTFQGDLTYAYGNHTTGSGIYLGDYRVSVNDSSLVFPIDAACASDPGCAQSSNVPIGVVNNTQASNVVLGVYINDLWQLTPRLRSNIGLRWDHLNGFTTHGQLDPTLNFIYAADGGTTWHAGFARYFQVPSFQGVSPTTQPAFANTTAAGPPGIATPETEDDYEWDVGVTHQLSSDFTLSADTFYERTERYLDTGQFGAVPIFAPFNYDRGYIWGTELAAKYQKHHFSAYGNLTVGMNSQRGVDTGQFNFDADELAYINSHNIVLDHQPRYGASAGASYHWRAYSLNLDGIYSSGLRAGFADLERLPPVVQLNLSVERSFQIAGLGVLTNRIAVLNILDRVNLIRPAEGIGIFQSAYGPRLTAFDTLALHF